jgi:hypothetical protein
MQGRFLKENHIMTHRLGAVITFGALACTLLACPPQKTPTDSGTEFDAGNPPPREACSGGCAANQVCDQEKRICVDACGGCPNDGTCVKIMEGVYECRDVVVACNGQVCERGQVACIGGGCACLSSARGSDDSCAPEGKWCEGTICAPPKAFYQCTPGNENAKCPTGYICDPVFGEDLAVCVKDCEATMGVCDRGEFCAQLDTGAGCLPAGLFRGHECNQFVPVDGGFLTVDGGVSATCAGNVCVRLTVPVSNTCLLKDGNGAIIDQPGKGTGNCTYAMFKFWNEGFFPFDTCRPPGQAAEGQTCKLDFSAGAVATQCGTGLECVVTNGGDTGVCLRLCNANPPSRGFIPQPACNAGEACVNIYRYTDPNDNAVVGVCMKTCDVFDPVKATCAPIGTTPTSCIPTEPSGEVVLSSNGSGVCIPQQATVAGPHMACAETNPFRGASCGNAQMCVALSGDEVATCTPVCDLTCVPPADGGVAPSRCATQPNATCAGGKSCRRVTTTTGAIVGFCR